MKFAKIIIAVLSALTLSVSSFAADKTVGATNAPVAVETVAAPAPANAWVVSLGGSGDTVTSGDSKTAFGADLSVGRTGHLLLPLEAGVRQGISYNTTAVYSTRVYADWTVLSLAQKTVDVFAGANIGLTYGDIQAAWTAAPEAGLRWWVKKDVAVLARAEFPFQLNDTADYTDTIKYFLGFQVKF